MIKKVFICAIVGLSIQNIVFAASTYSGKGATGQFTQEPIQIRNLNNGYSQIRTNIGGQTNYSIERSDHALMFQGLYNAALKALPQMAAEEKRQEKIHNANAKIITKKISVTAPSGVKISLEEDKNKDDFLVVNNKREKIAYNMVNQQPKTSNDTMTNSTNVSYGTFQSASINVPKLYEIYKQEQINSLKMGKKQKSYVEVVAASNDVDGLVKLVYGLRDKYGVSYTDAQKLMTFRNDNSGFNPENLLLPVEISKNNYEKTLKQTENRFKNLAFPKI